MHAFRYVKPLLNLPTVDLFGYALMRQHSRCANLEMKCLECIEYYGAHRGSIICQDYYDDWKECASTNLSVRFKLTHLKSRCNFQFKTCSPDDLKLEQIFLFQRLRVRSMDLQYKKKYWEYFRGEREYPYQPIPHPQGFFEPLRTHKNDFSDGNAG